MNNNLNTNSISQIKSPLLKCSNITLGYGSKNIVNNFNYTIHSGDYLSIIGRNGCGKTTFLRGLAGVLHPRAGKIELSSGLKRNQIGYLPQITVTQKDFPASVEEIVLSAFQGKNLLLPFYGKALRKRADECLELTHATNLRKESFRELSGGQKQRVLLARALCAAERLLLLDEPVTGLDPESSQNMYNIIKDIHENTTTTIVIETLGTHADRNKSTTILNFNELMQ